MTKAKHTGFPWDRRGRSFYEHGTKKKILDVSIAWKSSAEADANADLIMRALREYATRHNTPVSTPGEPNG